MAKIPETESTKAEPSRRSILSEHQPHQRPPATPPLDNKVRRLVGASTTPHSPSARHRALLTDPRWNTCGNRAFRQALALQLQRQYGNAYVGRLLRPSEVNRTVSGDAVVQAARPATAAVVARKPWAKPAPVLVPPTTADKAAPAAPAKAETESPVLSPSPAATTAAPNVPPKRGTAAPKPVAEQSAAKAERIAEVAAEEGATPTAGKVKSGQAPAMARAKGAAPASPQQDAAFQAVIGRARAVAHQQGHNNPAKRKAAEAQAAAPAPANDISSQAAAAQVGKMDAQQPQPFDRAGFKAALLQKIAQITPKNLKEADEFKNSNKAGALKGAVTEPVKTSQDKAQGDIKTTTKEAPDTSVARPKPVTPLPPTEAGPPPPNLGAAAAAPKPKSEQEVSLQPQSQSLDQQMAAAGITEKQLKNSNEPAFQGALQAKNKAQTHAQQAPVAYRQNEQAVLKKAQAEAVATADAQTQQMHATRQRQFNLIVSQQQTTQQADQQARAEVARRIEEIYQKTKQKTEGRLSRLDKEVNDLFDQGAEGARQAFENYVDSRMSHWKLERYLLKPGGPALWLADQLLGLPDEVNAFYKEGRRLYLERMDKVIDQVAAAVETGLNEAKKTISDGRAEIKDYVEKLPENLRKVGEQAATNIQDKFDTLRQSVDDKGNQLVDQLAHKYVENLQKIDERIDQMKAENRGLVDKAKEQIQGVIDTIVNLKNMLLGVLARAAAAINKIIQDPIDFLGNLVSGVKAGLSKFMSNLGTHLQKGLMEWLFGALAGAGIQIPQRFDLKGIISLVLQVLGLTYANFRARAVAIVGEPAVKTLETTAEVFMTLIREGVAGLWRFIKDKVGDIKSMIMDSILAFVRDRVIIAGITWIIGLLNPASAFVKACKAIYDIIMFFVSRGSQIMALVNAVIDSITAIANRALGVMATAVEGALARSIPVAIGFLASLLGLGDISGTIRQTIQKIQAPVNKAIDWVIKLAVKGVKAAGKLIGGLFGGKDKDNKGGKGNGEVGKTVTFSAAGETHRLWIRIQGNDARLMVASETMDVKKQLQWFREHIDQRAAIVDRNRAAERISRAEQLVTSADTDADTLVRHYREAQQAASQATATLGNVPPGGEAHLEQEEETLASVLSEIFELFRLDPKAEQELIDRVIYQSLDELGVELYYGVPELRAGLTGEEATRQQQLVQAAQARPVPSSDIFRVQSALWDLQIKFAQAAASRVTGPLPELDNLPNLFQAGGHTFFVDHSNNYIIPLEKVRRGGFKIKNTMVLPEDSSLPGRYNYTAFQGITIGEMRAMMHELVSGGRSGSPDRLAMFIAAMAAEPSRYSIAHVTNLLALVGAEASEPAFATLSMTQGGTMPPREEGTGQFVNDPQADPNLRGIRRLGVDVPRRVSDKDIDLVKRQPKIIDEFNSLRGSVGSSGTAHPTAMNLYVSIMKRLIRRYLETAPVLQR